MMANELRTNKKKKNLQDFFSVEIDWKYVLRQLYLMCIVLPPSDLANLFFGISLPYKFASTLGEINFSMA